MNSPTRRNYSKANVRYLIEDWERLVERKHNHGFGLDVLVQLADLDRCLSSMFLKERQVLMVCGQAGLTVRTAGVLLNVDFTVAYRRYMRALEKLTHLMNGDR